MAKEEERCYDDQEEEEEEGDYIDMDINPAPRTRRAAAKEEFEFQMSSELLNLGAGHHDSTSPADEIFYKGKLLPLHLPPRLQMVEALLLLQKPDADANASAATPFASCNASPATSCYVSGELNPEDFFFGGVEEEEDGRPKEPVGPRRQAKRPSSWARKLRQSSLGLKLKASKAYLQSLLSFARPPAPKPKEERSRSGRLKEEEGLECGGHRRSFSGSTTGVKRRSSSNKFSSSSSSSCSSSDSSSSSSSSLKRSSSVSSDKECSIQGAIAYCKKSQQAQAALGRKSVSDVEFYLKSESCRVDAGRGEKKEVM